MKSSISSPSPRLKAQASKASRYVLATRPTDSQTTVVAPSIGSVVSHSVPAAWPTVEGVRASALGIPVTGS